MQERPSSPQIEVKYLYPSLSLTLILSWDELSSGEHRTSHSPVLPGAPPQTNTIRVSKTLRNSQEWGTKAHNGSPNPLLLTSYKQLWGRLQEGLSAHKQWDGVTSPCPGCWEPQCPLGWACLPCRGVACCFLRPWSHGGKWEWRSSTEWGEEMPWSPSPTRALGVYPQLKFSVVPHCSQLIRATPTPTLWAQCKSITPKTTRFSSIYWWGPLSFVTSAISLELCYKLIIYSELRFFFSNLVHFYAS